ncbi:MAG: MipA/OmpV family protein [Gammaproteobacteria bacterium]|nr:MipA/OmpV family protein [Gammaproteobacteria bacterium]
MQPWFSKLSYWKFDNHNYSNLLVRACLVHALVFYAPVLFAADNKSSFWELGLGVAAFQTPHYLGSDQSDNYVLPYPHARLESDLLSVDRNVIRGHMLAEQNFQLDISFAGALKVDSEDNRLRQAMPDLDYIVEAGPSFNWLLNGKFNSDYYLSFDVPVRSVWATDLEEVEQIGWRLTPTLHWYQQWQNSNQWELDSKLRLLYATASYHEYFYAVTDAYASTTRPRYEAASGYGGWQYSLNIKTRNNGMILGILMVFSDVSAASYKDSPLVVEDYNYSIGIYASWILAEGRFY